MQQFSAFKFDCFETTKLRFNGHQGSGNKISFINPLRCLGMFQSVSSGLKFKVKSSLKTED